MLNAILQRVSDLMFRNAERLDMYVYHRTFPSPDHMPRNFTARLDVLQHDLDVHIDDESAHLPCLAHHSESCQLCHNDPADELHHSNVNHNESRADRHPLHRRATNCHVHHSAYNDEPCTTLCIFDDDLPF